ncbi:hypothetical protein K438DRAFT_1969939 [Mycena galopus ATCC 62051]|nr:hypothetical protein K438DRAFT_1969939 [Mycena galopus ATCC 62051]
MKELAETVALTTDASTIMISYLDLLKVNLRLTPQASLLPLTRPLLPIQIILPSMDSFTNTITKKAEDVVLPPTNEDGSGGSSGSCVVCKEDTTLPPMNEDGSGGSSGSCVIA